MKHKYTLKIEKIATEFEENFSVTRALLPSRIDLRNKFPKPYDQLGIGSCTAQALVGAFQFNNLSFMGSRLFLYYNERMMDGSIYQDAGSTLSQGIRALKKIWCVSRKIMDIC